MKNADLIRRHRYRTWSWRFERHRRCITRKWRGGNGGERRHVSKVSLKKKCESQIYRVCRCQSEKIPELALVLMFRVDISPQIHRVYYALLVSISLNDSSYPKTLYPINLRIQKIISSIFDKCPDRLILTITAKPYILWKSLFHLICSKFHKFKHGHDFF